MVCFKVSILDTPLLQSTNQDINVRDARLIAYPFASRHGADRKRAPGCQGIAWVARGFIGSATDGS